MFAKKIGWDTKLPVCQQCSCNADSGQVECKLCNSNGLLALNLPHALGYLHDMNHDARAYLGI